MGKATPGLIDWLIEEGSFEGFLTGWLDLLLGEEVAKLALVPQLKGVGERDPDQIDRQAGS